MGGGGGKLLSAEKVLAKGTVSISDSIDDNDKQNLEEWATFIASDLIKNALSYADPPTGFTFFIDIRVDKQ